MPRLFLNRVPTTLAAEMFADSIKSACRRMRALDTVFASELETSLLAWVTAYGRTPPFTETTGRTQPWWNLYRIRREDNYGQELVLPNEHADACKVALEAGPAAFATFVDALPDDIYRKSELRNMVTTFREYGVFPHIYWGVEETFGKGKQDGEWEFTLPDVNFGKIKDQTMLDSVREALLFASMGCMFERERFAASYFDSFDRKRFSPSLVEDLTVTGEVTKDAEGWAEGTATIKLQWSWNIDSAISQARDAYDMLAAPHVPWASVWLHFEEELRPLTEKFYHTETKVEVEVEIPVEVEVPVEVPVENPLDKKLALASAIAGFAVGKL